MIFEVDLKQPDKNVKGIKLLAGTMTYLIADGTKDVDLGISKLRPTPSASAQKSAVFLLIFLFISRGTIN